MIEAFKSLQMNYSKPLILKIHSSIIRLVLLFILND